MSRLSQLSPNKILLDYMFKGNIAIAVIQYAVTACSVNQYRISSYDA